MLGDVSSRTGEARLPEPDSYAASLAAVCRDECVQLSGRNNSVHTFVLVVLCDPIGVC